MDIRKISIGADYKFAMHYIVGQEVLGGSHKIHHIKLVEDMYKIWIQKGDEIFLWKGFFKVLPISLEFNINF